MVDVRHLAIMVFVFGLGCAFWQYFEYAYTLYEVGIIVSPVWSGLAGFPFIHHGYWGFILAAIGFLVIEEDERRVRATKEEST